MQRNPSAAGGHPETPAELIARITAENAGAAESTGRHGAVAVLPERGRSRAGRGARPGDRPDRGPLGAEPTERSTGRHVVADPAVVTDPAVDAVAPPGPVDSESARSPAPHRRRRRAVSRTPGAAALVTRDAAAPSRSLARRLAPLAVGAVVVVLATFIAATVRPEPNPQEPDLSAALVDAEDPSVVRVAPDDVTPPTAPPPAPAPSAEETVGADEAGTDEAGAPVVEAVTWTPAGGDEFTTGLSPAWTVYDDGNRSPDAVSVEDGVLVVRGDAAGRSGGVAWAEGSRFGRWEMRARFPQGDARYHPTLLLWPTDVPWPAGGEIDFAETASGSGTVSFFLHHGADNAQLYTDRPLDITQWHDYAVEWTEDRVTGYLDGQKWFESTNPATLPPGRMRAAVQLDWFPDDAASTGPAAPTEMHVDYVRMYTASRP